jgi:hypothetical protein
LGKPGSVELQTTNKSINFDFFIQRSHTGTIREMIAKKFPGSEVITAGGSGWSFKKQTQKTSL